MFDVDTFAALEKRMQDRTGMILSDIFAKALEAISAQDIAIGSLSRDDKVAIDLMLDSALRKEPDNAAHLKLRGLLLFYEDQFSEASVFLKKAEKYLPDDNGIRDALGWSLFSTGNYGKALPYLQSQLMDYPEDMYLQFMTGFALFDQGKKGKAQKLLQPLLQNEMDTLSESFSRELGIIALSAFPGKRANPKLT